MKLKILAFGIAQDAMGGKIVELELPDKSIAVGRLKAALTDKYPELSQLVNFLIAVNADYMYDEKRIIKAGDEVAIIPPTSGG